MASTVTWFILSAGQRKNIVCRVSEAMPEFHSSGGLSKPRALIPHDLCAGFVHRASTCERRKIGGPLMTVEDRRTDGFVSVVWFDIEGRVQRDCFAPSTLHKWQIVEE